jgi:hypothetical protein
MNLLLLLALAIPFSCLALLVSLALLGVLTLGGVIHLISRTLRIGPARTISITEHHDYECTPQA